MATAKPTDARSAAVPGEVPPGSGKALPIHHAQPHSRSNTTVAAPRAACGRRGSRWIGAGLALAAAGPAVADDVWRIVPRIGASETWTSNVGLAPSGQEKSDFVTEVDPGLRINGDGPRFKFHGDAELEKLLYKNESDADHTNTVLHADGNGELLRKLLFVDAHWDIHQEYLSLVGARGVDNTNLTSNLDTVRTWSLSPYVTNRYGTFATSEFRVTHGALSSGANGGLLDSTSNRVDAKVNSGTQFRIWDWSVNAFHEKVEYDNAPNVTTEAVRGRSSYLLVSNLRAVGELGYEHNDYNSIGGERTSGGIYSAGLRWEPSRLTHVEALVGHRYFGTTFSVEAEQRGRLSYWNVSYRQDINTGFENLQIPASTNTATFLDNLFKGSMPDTASRQLYIQNLIQQQGLSGNLVTPATVNSTTAYIDKLFKASAGYTGSRNTAIVTAYDEVNDATNSGLSLGAADFGVSRYIHTDGLTANWTVRLSERISTVANADVQRINFRDIGRTDNVHSLSIGVNDRVTRKTTVTFSVRHTERSSTDPTQGYTENAVFGSAVFFF